MVQMQVVVHDGEKKEVVGKLHILDDVGQPSPKNKVTTVLALEEESEEEETYYRFPTCMILLVGMQLTMMLLFNKYGEEYLHQDYGKLLPDLWNFFMGLLFIEMCFGAHLEMMYPRSRVALIYLTGWLITQISTDIKDPIPTSSFWEGACGGALALFGAHFAIVLTNMEGAGITLWLIRCTLLITCYMGSCLYLYDTAAWVSKITPNLVSVRVDCVVNGLLVTFLLLQNWYRESYQTILTRLVRLFFAVLTLTMIDFSTIGVLGYMYKGDFFYYLMEIFRT